MEGYALATKVSLWRENSNLKIAHFKKAGKFKFWKSERELYKKFELTVVNNWFIIMEGYALATKVSLWWENSNLKIAHFKKVGKFKFKIQTEVAKIWKFEN
jgi:hypothetical protein